MNDVLRYGVERIPVWSGEEQPESDYVPDSIGNYFAGLVDGEGCFSVSRAGVVEFVIQLRDDDTEFLATLRDELGGIGRFSRATMRGPNARPLVRWSIGRRKEVRWLVDLLDAYPLRLKKARDYAIWREAAIDWYCGASARELGEFADRLREAREYRELLRVARTGEETP